MTQPRLDSIWTPTFMLLCAAQFFGYAQHFILQPTLLIGTAIRLAGCYWMFLFIAALNILGLIVTWKNGSSLK